MKKLPIFIFLFVVFGISIFGQTPTPTPGTVEAEKIRQKRSKGNNAGEEFLATNKYENK